MLTWLFRCRHPRITWPQTTPMHGTRVSCLDCGERVAYDWSEMRIAAEPAPVVGAGTHVFPPWMGMDSV